MSNYPPGVTGREWQIAGADREVDERRTCGAENVEVLVPRDEVESYIDLALGVLTGRVLVREGADRVDRAIVHLTRAFEAFKGMDKTEVAVCPFDGTVTVQQYGTTLTWVCPLCDTDHEEDLADD